MEVLLVWIVLSAVVAAGASRRGRSGFGWFLLSVLISPLLAGLALLIVGDLREDLREEQSDLAEARVSRTCPYCAERIKLAAVVCRHCGRDVPAATSEELRAAARAGHEGESVAVGVMILLALGIVLSVAWLWHSESSVVQKTTSEIALTPSSGSAPPAASEPPKGAVRAKDVKPDVKADAKPGAPLPISPPQQR